MESRFSGFEFRWLALCAALALGEACGLAAASFASAWPVAAVAAVLVALYGFGFDVRGWRYPAVALAGLALALLAAERRAEALESAWFGAGPHVLRVEVDGAAPARRGRGGRVSFAGAAGPIPVRVFFDAPEDFPLPRPGEVWECAGWLSLSPSERDRGRYAFWARGKGSYARRAAAAPGGRLRGSLAAARADLSRRVGIGLGHDPSSAALNRAILLGERSQIDRATRSDFVAAGTIHVFAISGLHVMVVARVLATLLTLACVPCRLMAFALLPALWLYVAMIGAPPSAVRAAAMAGFYFSAPLFWRRPDGLVAWSLTFLAVYAADPWRIVDVGCALSFAVMLSLVVFGLLARQNCRGAAGVAGTTLAAWAAGAPIAAAVFGRVTPGGLVSNLVLAFVAGCDVAAGVVGVAASFVSETLAAHVNNFAALATRLMVGVSKAVASVPGANFEVAPWSPWQCLGWYLALGLAAWLWRRSRSGFWCR